MDSLEARDRPGSVGRRKGCWRVVLFLLVIPSLLLVLLLGGAAALLFREPAALPREETCRPEQEWSSTAACSVITVEEGLQSYQAYRVEAGVPTHGFCRAFLDLSGPARGRRCGKPDAYAKVACADFGIQASASCFVCSERKDDQVFNELRAFADDCSLGLSMGAIDLGLSRSMCRAKTSPLCIARPKKGSSGKR